MCKVRVLCPWNDLSKTTHCCINAQGHDEGPITFDRLDKEQGEVRLYCRGFGGRLRVCRFATVCVARRLIHDFDQAPGTLFDPLPFYLALRIYIYIYIKPAACSARRRNSLCDLDGLRMHARGEGALSPHWPFDAPTEAHSKPDPSVYFYDAILCVVWRVVILANGHGPVCVRSHGVPRPPSRYSIQQRSEQGRKLGR